MEKKPMLYKTLGFDEHQPIGHIGHTYSHSLPGWLADAGRISGHLDPFAATMHHLHRLIAIGTFYSFTFASFFAAAGVPFMTALKFAALSKAPFFALGFTVHAIAQYAVENVFDKDKARWLNTLLFSVGMSMGGAIGMGVMLASSASALVNFEIVPSMVAFSSQSLADFAKKMPMHGIRSLAYSAMCVTGLVAAGQLVLTTAGMVKLSALLAGSMMVGEIAANNVEHLVVDPMDYGRWVKETVMAPKVAVFGPEEREEVAERFRP